MFDSRLQLIKKAKTLSGIFLGADSFHFFLNGYRNLFDLLNLLSLKKVLIFDLKKTGATSKKLVIAMKL